MNLNEMHTSVWTDMHILVDILKKLGMYLAKTTSYWIVTMHTLKFEFTDTAHILSVRKSVEICDCSSHKPYFAQIFI